VADCAGRRLATATASGCHPARARRRSGDARLRAARARARPRTRARRPRRASPSWPSACAAVRRRGRAGTDRARAYSAARRRAHAERARRRRDGSARAWRGRDPLAPDVAADQLHAELGHHRDQGQRPRPGQAHGRLAPCRLAVEADRDVINRDLHGRHATAPSGPSSPGSARTARKGSVGGDVHAGAGAPRGGANRTRRTPDRCHQRGVIAARQFRRPLARLFLETSREHPRGPGQ
jgi:hypothetical protein